jgi:diaminohydroxyphosphoribosylaminopyrimidine deaminase/5-amino-6-(5-phosphoribosylamino)uracil reductase
MNADPPPLVPVVPPASPGSSAPYVPAEEFAVDRQQAFDRHMMTIALRMARRGLGATAPNPAVGAVIANEATGEVIARGSTQPGGRPHAETEAIRRAGPRAKGATMYVTLEPCAHHGKTPPCADAIIEAGLERLVVGVGDPDPRTAGQGIARLRAAGIAVTEGVLEEDARWMTLGHILRLTQRRPFILLKMALSEEGSVPRGHAGKAVIVTGSEARAQGHLMRAEADAILVGRQTVLDDDPELTCRLPGLSRRSPIRVIATTAAQGLAGTRLVKGAGEHPVWILCGSEARLEAVDALEQEGCRVLRLPVVAGRVSVNAIAEALAAEGVTRLLVEGGEKVWRSYAAAGLADEAVVFHAHVTGMAMELHRQSVENAVRHYLSPMRFAVVEGRRIGEDTMWRLRPWRVETGG